MDNTFEFCFLGDINNGVQYVEFRRIASTPNSKMPQGAVLRSREIEKPCQEKYCKWNGTALEAMTDEERAGRDVYDTAQAEADEAERQASKPDGLKEVENNFYALIYAIFGDYTKRGFDEIQASIEAIKQTDFNAATELGLKLLAIDAAGKRYSQLWWDDAARHT